MHDDDDDDDSGGVRDVVVVDMDGYNDMLGDIWIYR